jgi:anti-anti-sigma factor
MQIHGSLDSMTAAIFDEKASHILARNPKLVMLDMKFLDYISSAGVRSVFKLVKASKAKGGKVGASNRQPQISKVFEIIKALPDMPIFTDDAEMDDYLNAVQEKIRNGEDF